VSESRYDPFVPGRFAVVERSMLAFDTARSRSFPCDIWQPMEAVGVCPLILLSHSSGGSGRRGYTFLTNHLASHGYIVAGLNHSELVAPELGRRDGETTEQRARRHREPHSGHSVSSRLSLNWSAAQTRPCRNRGSQLRRLDSACRSRRRASNSGCCGTRAGWKFESEAWDSAGEAGVPVEP
jgi:hypothetical protein